MKPKLRNRLDKIEKALKNLTKEVRALHPFKDLVSEGHDDSDNNGDSISWDKPKAIGKVTGALKQTRKQRSSQ
jgi:hypothetical protein